MPDSFSIVIPVLNEEKTLDAILDRISAYPRFDQIIIVNDGSTDKTAEVLKRRLAHPEGKRFRVITHPVNRGKGAAIQSAVAVAQTTFLGIQDADTEYDPADLERLYESAVTRKSDVVYGSRFLGKNPNIYPLYRFGNKLLTCAANILGRGSLTDSYTCYKIMSVERWRALNLVSNGFEVEAEITIKCLLAGWRMEEHPIRYMPRTFAEGKKIRAKDALKGIFTMVKCVALRKFPGRLR